MTPETVPQIVEEMRDASGVNPLTQYVMCPTVIEWADRLLAAHTRQMEEALAEPSLEEYEMLRYHPNAPCNPGWDTDFIAVMKVRRARYIK